MAGKYTEGISKVLSGVYTLIKAAVAAISQLGARGVIAYPVTANWGPINQLMDIENKNHFKALYNPGAAGLTSTKVYLHAYNGNPKKVQVYRMATAAAAKATVVLNDDAAAKSIELETLYPTDRAFTAVVKDGSVGNKVIDIVEAGVKLASFEGDTVAKLVAAINVSDVVRVKSQGANVPVNTAGTAFAGGNNGSVATATEYAAFLDTLEADRQANAFALDAVTDEAILVTAKDWTLRVRDEGFYITFVRGGDATWDANISLANAKSKELNSRAIVNVGNGCDGYTAAEMAIFIAARVGSVALNATLCDEPVPYTAVNKKYKPIDRETAKKSGTILFVQDGDNILIDEAVNTLTSPTAEESAEFGKVRISNALDHIAKDLEKFGEAYKRTRSNTSEARSTYAATVENDYLKQLAAMEVIQEGYFYIPDPDFHGKNAIYAPAIDEAFFFGDFTPVDSMERIYQKMNVHF